jgi:hypothetical protein
MAGLESHALNVLKGLRALVGEVVFQSAIASLSGAEVAAPAVVVAEAEAIPVPVPNKKRTRTITEEQRAVITRNMTGLQRFTKTVKTEMGESVSYATVKKTAGERWSAMTKEQKEAWMNEHVTVVAAAPVVEPTPTPAKGRGRPKKDTIQKVTVHKE